jgi:glycosyltransferase involved in cell wall biosynthesis
MPAPSSAPREPVRVGVFTGPWDTGHRARDGAVLGFADVEHAVTTVLRGDPGFRVRPLDVQRLCSDALPELLGDLDVVFANCGPAAALLLEARARNDLSVRILREVRTIGWIGYLFQERIAHALGRPGDRCLHVSRYARDVWRAVRDDPGDAVFYPMITAAPAARAGASTRPAGAQRIGYFSRVARDKGFHYVAPIVERLQRAGWSIASLTVAGAIDDPALFDGTVARLAQAGVATDCLGPVDHLRAMTVLDAVDTVLFPSVSSLEACGRVVVEARSRGIRVIASDYCGAADVLEPPWRLPLLRDITRTGVAAWAFEALALDLDRWCPPGAAAPCTDAGALATYALDAQVVRDLAIGVGPGRSRESDHMPRPRPIVMTTDFRRWSVGEALDRCARVRQTLQREVRDRTDLVDLGGAFKRALLATGFDPSVSFR